MGKMTKYCSVLLIVFVMSGCLWDPYDGQIIDKSWLPQHFNILWPKLSTNVQFECHMPGATAAVDKWVAFAKGKTDIIATAPLPGKNPLYHLQLDAVIPANCWKVAPKGSPAPYQAQLRATIGTNPLPAFNDKERNCVLHGDATHQFTEQPIDWVTRAKACSGRNTITLYAKKHNSH